MSANVSAGWHAAAGHNHDAARIARTVVPRLAAGAYAAGIAIVVGLLIVNGPAMRAAADRHDAEQIDRENRVYCERFGMAHGTERFAACAGDLAEIRRLHTERINESARGLF